jgi:type II secretory pathway component PulM
LALLAAIVVGLIGWYGVASPLQRTAGRAVLDRIRAAEVLAEVEAARATMDAIAVRPDGGLDDILTLSAAEAGFALQSQREQNADEVAVSGRAPDAAALFGWLMMLRNNHGIRVGSLNVVRESDAALRVDALLVRSVR